MEESTDEDLFLLAKANNPIPIEFKEEPVHAPFYENYGDDSVALASGALNYQKILLSVPGRNGLDVNISLRYNSQEAVITKMSTTLQKKILKQVCQN